MDRFSVSSEIRNAIEVPSVADRGAALRKLAQKLCERLPAEPNSSALCGEVIAHLHQQTLARIYESLRLSARANPVDELDVVMFAEERKTEHVICVLSQMTGLPPEKVEPALSGKSADLLLVICRTLNFAWSSVHILLRLHKQTLDAACIEILHEEYHNIPIQAAMRFRRFLHVHMPGQTESRQSLPS